MKVAELLESRQANWRQLEQLCVQMEGRQRRKLGGAGMARFASLYRAACADLALADAYQLPAATVAYLHQLVARAYNQLYRSRRFNFPLWAHELFVEVPRRLRKDKYLWIAMALFWGLFLFSFELARLSPDFVKTVTGKAMMRSMRDMYSQPLNRQNGGEASFMLGFYIMNNTTIGLQCFALGLLFGVGGLAILVFNAVQMGAIFGYMSTMPEWSNFGPFVTAHGPFELTAIVFCAAAGMHLGFSLLDTKGLSRAEALRQAARQMMPVAGAAIALFAMAGLIEGNLSPSSAPYFVKAAVAIISTGMLIFYIVVLGRERYAAASPLINETATTGA